MKGINIFLADGFEDVEAIATNDVLRRGGLDVNVISIYDEPFITSSKRHRRLHPPGCGTRS